MDFIEERSMNANTEVSAGRTYTQVHADNPEYVQLNEKVTYFDLVFRAVNPVLSDCGVGVCMHIDMEPQKTYRPGYPIEKRGIYYLARMLGSQLSLVTDKTDYGILEKCYSIWICRDDVPLEERYTVSFYKIKNTYHSGACRPAVQNYDLGRRQKRRDTGIYYGSCGRKYSQRTQSYKIAETLRSDTGKSRTVL